MEPGRTQQARNLQLGLAIIILVLVLGFILGAFVASRIGWLRRLFCTRREMQACLREKAIQAFQMYRVSKTKEATGVIILISSFEHMVFVLGDTEISKHFNNEDFVEVKDTIVEGFGRAIMQMAWSKAFVFVGKNLRSTVRYNLGMKTNFVMI